MRPADFALERYLAQHEFSTRHVACASDPETLSVGELLALEPGAQEQLLALRLGYTETQGHPALRQAIAAVDGAVGADDVVVFCGGGEPIFTFMHVALSAGDHAIVLTPTYQSLHEVARSVGAEISAWPLREAAGWQPDPDELQALVRPNTRALIVNTPNNPTGALLSHATFDHVVALARRHGLWLFADEVYRGVEQDPAARLPLAAGVYERALSLGVMAKTYGLAGLRLGWLSCRDPALRDRLIRFKDYLTICNPAPSELLATIALKHGERLRERTRQIVAGNVRRFERTIATSRGRLQWVRPTAGTMGFARVDGSATAFAQDVLARSGVLFAPSPLFDAGDSHVRVGLGRLSFSEAMDALDAAVSSSG